MLAREHLLSDYLLSAGMLKADQTSLFSSRLDSVAGDAFKALKEIGLSSDVAKATLSEVFPIEFSDDLLPPKPSELGWALTIQEFVEGRNIYPYRSSDDCCFFAISDFFLTEYHHQLEMLLGKSVKFLYCPQERFEKLFKIREKKEETTEHIDDNSTESDDAESPIIKAVNLVFLDALNDGASDIHIEPFEKALRIRFRVDGVLRQVKTFPTELQSALLSRIKLMAGMNISEKRIPQDGRIKFQILGADYDMRVNTLPSAHGETAVLRLLSKESVSIDLGKSGFRDETLLSFRNSFRAAHGLCLVTGPTGSGKTTTLYGAVNEINDVERKIFTIEDPVEYQLGGIVQIPVNAKVGMTFAAGLRAALRQDPDIVMIGEIRDGETADIAVKAALTGHLVLATLHTNSAPGAISRLLDMGVESFMLSSTIEAVLAQRLQRRICSACTRELKITDKQRILFAGVNMPSPDFICQGEGCEQCGGSGYKGRLGIHEILVASPEIREKIASGCSENELAAAAVERGMVDLRRDSLLKVAAGQTTIEECIRVTGLENS